DADGMLDAWELHYFGSLNQAPTSDFDNDGVSNLSEFLEGTDPTDRNSFRPRLNLSATNGVINPSPAGSNYLMGTGVTLTAVPNPGFYFINWLGNASGNANPLLVTMTTNKTITARFRVPGDDFDQRIFLDGVVANSTGLKNVGASKETGEPNHAGNTGGK